MFKPVSKSARAAAAVFFCIFSTFRLYSAGIDVDEPEISFWLGLLGADAAEIESCFSGSYIEIEPAVIDSRADRIIWYKEGLTVWFSDGCAVQLRADSTGGGRIAGLRGGMTAADIKRLCGRPWIESSGSLYYNLPWTGGAARLRFVFSDNGLKEIYLFYVR